jgi:hypothetical protein
MAKNKIFIEPTDFSEFNVDRRKYEEVLSLSVENTEEDVSITVYSTNEKDYATLNISYDDARFLYRSIKALIGDID